MADQLNTVSKRRLISQLGQLSAKDVKAIEQVIKIQLGIKL